ncbi:MAG: branched-chain amino acid transport system substrate-binding protein [Burkholderiales bacterium]|jgi:branched-chain amino acid transport system substrate-binding protein
MDRRSFVKQSAALGGLALANSLGSLGNALAQGGPIRIGLLTPLTGVVASGGKEIAEGFNMYWNQAGRKVAGREIQILTEDDGSNPDVSLQKARKLVEQQNVHFLVGCLLANTGLAVAEYVKGNGVPYFIPVIAADDLTQRKRIPNVVRVAGYSASQMPRALADWAYKKKGIRKVVTISQDYTFGHEQCGGFAQVFTELGGTIVGQHWNPLNTQDFSPYLGQIMSAKPDAVFAMETGADATRLIQQWSNFGLKGKITLLGAQNFTDQSVIRTLGAESEGIVTSAHFAEGNDAPATRKFVADYEAAYKQLPSLYGFSHYSAAMWLHEAMNAINGNVEDRPKFLDAVRKVVLKNSPLGRPVQLDSYGNPVYDLYIRQVVKRPDGRYWNVALETYPEVSQFWTYKPEEYMKQPSYSRTFQGIKKS